MTSEFNRGGDILDQYRSISSKLKRRFLRKPNVSEACDSFAALAHHCEALELPAYAGLCWISTARCEGSLSNIPGETSSLIRAARQFLTAEQKDYDLGCPSPSQENLGAALGCYSYAISRCAEESPIPVGLNLEIVDFLKRVDKNENVEEHLWAAIDLCDDNSLDTKIYCLGLLAEFYNSSGDHTSALNSFNEIVRHLDKLDVNGARAETLLKCEVNRVLLLLILKPAPQKLAPELMKVLEKYTWGDLNDKTLKACGMSEKMFLSLQSLVATCQSLDVTNLDSLESELWVLLGNEERDLLRTLVRIYLNS